MYLHFTPQIIQWIYPELLWHCPRDEKKIYLTFDDGPVPEATGYVLDMLAAYEAKATFFCVGENVQKNPKIFEQILASGHQVGNHTFNHLNGRRVGNDRYIKNIQACDEVFGSFGLEEKKYFRPPYGRIKPSQIKQLADHHKIVMWDVLSGDFDPTLTKEMCLYKSIKYTKAGSLVVFHDSLKTIETLRYVLPKYLAHFTEQAFTFEAL